MSDARSNFRCREFACVLQVNACVARRAASKASGRAHVRTSPTCIDCPMGRSHAAGELPTTWPDGVSAQRDVLLTAASGAPPVVPTVRKLAIPAPWLRRKTA